MKTILSGWNFFRAIRFILGVVVIAKSINDGEFIFAFIGGMLAILALANIGCCGAESCTLPRASLLIKNQKTKK